jgi:inner membrane protein
MDNLTHSLFGAILGQVGLKKKTGLAMPTLIIGANLPDIDAACVVYGVESMAMRRGITHGPLALLLLPLLLWALMLGFDRWQTRRAKRPADRLPIHKGWLLAFAYLGCFTHPALDWMNNYGIRLLEPFSSTWYYGDTLFIIDLWLWIGMGGIIYWSRRQEKRGNPHWRQTAAAGAAAVCVYIAVNGVITGHAETLAKRQLQAAGYKDVLAVASAPPVAFWKRDIFWRSGGFYGGGLYGLGQGAVVDLTATPTGVDDARLAGWLKADAGARAFYFWSRMPIIEQDEPDGPVFLRDQRYHDKHSRSRFQVRLGDVNN